MRGRQGSTGGDEQAARGAIEELYAAWTMEPATDPRPHRGVARHGGEVDGQPGQRQDRELRQLRGAEVDEAGKQCAEEEQVLGVADTYCKTAPEEGSRPVRPTCCGLCAALSVIDAVTGARQA
nr:hypothetical protein BN993_02918 [Virgibacillus halodenitrificans]